MNVEKIKKYIQIILFTQIGIIPVIVITVIYVNLPWVDKEALKNVNTIMLITYIVAIIYGIWLNHRGFAIDKITCKKDKKLDTLMLIVTIGADVVAILCMSIIAYIYINLQGETIEFILSSYEIGYAMLVAITMIAFPLNIFLSRIRSGEWYK